jgi:hypothetical protein
LPLRSNPLPLPPLPVRSWPAAVLRAVVHTPVCECVCVCV